MPSVQDVVLFFHTVPNAFTNHTLNYILPETAHKRFIELKIRCGQLNTWRHK